MLKTTWLWLVLALMAVSGCAEAVSENLVSSTLETDVADERADTIGNWRVQTDGMTMWVDTVLDPVEHDGSTTWMLRGRVSKTMTGFRAYTSTGHAFDSQMVSARRFEVALSEGEVLDVVGGARVYLDFFAQRGATPMYHGAVVFAPRFANWAGSSAIYVYRSVNPVIVGDGLKFRGRASTRAGFELEMVYTADGAAALFDDAPNAFHFDWSPRALHLAAAMPTEPVWFRGYDTATTPVEKSARLEFRLVQLGLGTEHPFDAWPPERCDSEVRSCLQTLESSDTEACGWAPQVKPCLRTVTLPLRPDASLFARDLKDALRGWYPLHGDDVRALNGRTLQAALDAISPGRVGTVDREEIDALGYDPEHFDVLFHPDPVFRDSDRLWYGTYDHGGTLIGIETVD